MTIARRVALGAVDRLPPRLIRAMASSYCAGTTAADAVREVDALHRQGASATVSALGEAATTEAGAAKHLGEVRQVLAALRERPELDVRLGVKLTGLGLNVSRELAAHNLRLLADEAGGRLIEVDMEQLEFVDVTLAIVRAQENVAAVVQAYLPRTAADVSGLVRDGIRTRIVKGAYHEPNAWQLRESVRASFLALTRRYLEAGIPVGIATHDEYLIVRALEEIERFKATAFEFQMIMGVQAGLRRALIAAGRPTRVTVHFGEDLHLWSIRRLKENPEIARYAVSGLRELVR